MRAGNSNRSSTRPPARPATPATPITLLSISVRAAMMAYGTLNSPSQTRHVHGSVRSDTDTMSFGPAIAVTAYSPNETDAITTP